MNKKIRALALLLTVSSSLFFPLASLAQTTNFWTLTDSGQLSSGEILPRQEVLATSQAFNIPVARVAALQEGQPLSLALPSAQVTFDLVQANSFTNGDQSWAGSNTLGDSLLLTHSQQSLRGRLVVNGVTYQIASLRENDAYLGWLYSYNDHMPIKPHDAPEFSGKGTALGDYRLDYVAISEGDVSIEQNLSSSRVQIGDQVDIEIVISNESASILSDEDVTVLFLLDDTELLALQNGCSSGSLSGYAAIQCSINSLPPGSSVSFDFTVTMTGNAYPYAASSVFVGDVFDPENQVRSDAFIYGLQDTLSDSDGDGISDFNEALIATDPFDSGSTLAAEEIPVIDLMFLYTSRYADELGSLYPETEINHLVTTVNSYYLNSNALVTFRPIYYGEVNFDFQDDLHIAFDALSDGTGVFSNTRALRDNIGADIIVLMDGIVGPDGSCGVGSLPGNGFNGELFHPNGFSTDLFTVLYAPGFGSDGGCDEQTLAHELGHNLGLAHSRRDPNAGGALDWGHGYGIDGQFVTIMAYASRFPGAESLPLFSTPDSTDCNAQSCGINRFDSEQGADSVHAINHSRFQVANIRRSRALSVATLDPASSSGVTMFGGASSNGVDKSSFAASESIDVSATLNIPSEHVGLSGLTYIVISVPGAGFFYVDSQGAYQSWDGQASTLGGSINERPLTSSEELVAFSNFVPQDYGVAGIGVQVFFAYSVNNLEVFAYSSQGVSFTIN